MGVIGTEVVEFREQGLAELDAKLEAFHGRFKAHAEERKKLAGLGGLSGSRLFGKDSVRDSQRLAAGLKDVNSAAYWANKNLTALNSLTFNKQYTADVRDLAAALRETTNAGAMLAGRLTSRRGGLAMPAVASVASVATPVPGTTPALPAPTLTSPPAPPRPASVSHPPVFNMLPIDTGTYGVKGVDAPGEKAARVRAGLTKQKAEELQKEAERMKAADARNNSLGNVAARNLTRAAKELEGAGKLLTKIGVGAAAAGAGLAVKGFSGTVTGEQFSRELDMLAREFAGSFKTTLEYGTRKMREAREGLEEMDQEDQGHVKGAAAFGAAAWAAGKAGLGAVARFPVAAAGLWAIGQVADGVGVGNELGKDQIARRRKGDLKPQEFKDAGLDNLRDIKDDDQFKEAIQKEALKVEKQRKKLTDETRKPSSLFQMGLNQADSVLGFRLGILGNDTKGNGRGHNVNQIELAEGIGLADKKLGALRNMHEERFKGIPRNRLGGPNADRDQLMLAQAGFNEVGGSYFDIQTELAKASSNEKAANPNAKMEELLQRLVDRIEGNAAANAVVVAATAGVAAGMINKAAN